MRKLNGKAMQCLMSVVSARGELRFTTVNSRVGAKVFIEFLKRLLHNAERTIFLIVYGRRVHKAKIIARFVEFMNYRLHLLSLPPYSRN